jgi:hypothetical protein
LSSTPAYGQTNIIPEPVARLADVMSGFPGTWALCGGWAVDAWLGYQSRVHGDIDMVVFEDDLDAVLGNFTGWQLLAHDGLEPDSEQQWDGRGLKLPAHIHARPGDGFEIDIQVTEMSGSACVLSQGAGLTRDWAECVEASDWGLPTLLPELVLFYKAQELRAKDQGDFRALLPRLTAEQRLWLREAVSRSRPDHPWLSELPR